MSGMRDAVEAAARALCELENAPNCIPADYYGEAIAALTAVHYDEMRAVVDAVGALHRPAEEEGYAAECVGLAGDTCDHSVTDCPLVKFQVCEHCAGLANGGDIWDDVIPADVIWPCPTAALANLPSDEGVGGDGA